MEKKTVRDDSFLKLRYKAKIYPNGYSKFEGGEML